MLHVSSFFAFVIAVGLWGMLLPMIQVNHANSLILYILFFFPYLHGDFFYHDWDNVEILKFCDRTGSYKAGPVFVYEPWLF